MGIFAIQHIDPLTIQELIPEKVRCRKVIDPKYGWRKVIDPESGRPGKWSTRKVVDYVG